MIQAEGFSEFKQHQHTQFWKLKNTRNKGKGFGVLVAKTWYWYDTWLIEVKEHCRENAVTYGKNSIGKLLPLR